MANGVDQAPQIGEEQIQLLERLCDACAVSGDEGEVRTIVQEQVRPHLLSLSPLIFSSAGRGHPAGCRKGD